MKKIYYIALSFAAALLMSSCDKINNGLTRLPIDDINPDAYFTSESECQLWLNRCYTTYLVSPASTAVYWGDEAVNTDPFGIVEGTRLVTSGNTGETAWGWDTMRRINLFFEHADNCKDEAVRNKYLGVASFFRALGYYHKVVRFGDVPFYDHVVSSTDESDLRRPRDPRGYVMLQIMKDLDFAIENLPSSPDVAHVTKWTALALKSRAALFEGSWRIYHANDVFAPANDPTEFDGQPVSLSAEYFLNIAAEASKAIMDSGVYSVYTKGATPYRDLFNSDDAKAEEVILARLYNNTTSELKNYGHNLPYYFTNKNAGLTKRFINMYLNSNGTRFTDAADYEKVWYLDEVKDRDPRLSQTVMCPGYKMVGETATTFNDFSTTLTGYKPIKWASRPDNSKQSKGVADLAIFRYAEILLNYAEAKAELGTITQADLDLSVNKLRDRVNMPHIALDVTVDPYMEKCYPNAKDSKGSLGLILELRRERAVELVFEGNHLWDMLRWREGAQLMDNTFPYFGTDKVTGYYGIYIPGPGIYDMDGDGVADFELYVTTASNTVKTAVKLSSLQLTDPDNPFSTAPTKGYVTAYKNKKYCDKWNEERDYLYPVPQPQINLTQGALTQNPNWDTTNKDEEE